jgi:hypothetical protein
MGTVGANRVRYYERIPPLSALAILIPVGKTNAPAAARCPLCGAMGEPLMLPIHLQAVHGYGQPAIGTQPVQPHPAALQRAAAGLADLRASTARKARRPATRPELRESEGPGPGRVGGPGVKAGARPAPRAAGAAAAVGDPLPA